MKYTPIVVLAAMATVITAMPLSPEQSDAVHLWRARHVPRGAPVRAIPGVVSREMTKASVGSEMGSMKPRGVTESSGYSEDYAVLGMYLAGAAYCTSSAQQSWSCGPCKQVSGMQVEQTFAFPSTATYGYIGYLPSQNLIAVAFRGTTPTTSLQSILQDLKVFKTDPLWGIPGALVHKGFYESYMSAQSVVHTAVDSLLKDYPSAQVGIFGHSLGGAMATIGALDLVLNARVTRLAPVITVGQPRVGNQAFAAFYDQAVTQPYGHYRVVHYRDIVPHLPPKAIFNFYHIADEVWYPQEDMTPHQAQYVTCQSGEDPNCSDGLTFKTSVKDHLEYFMYAVSGSCYA